MAWGALIGGALALGGSLLSRKGARGPKVEDRPTLTPEQQATLRSLNTTIQGQIGKGVDPYSGRMSADPSVLQQGAFDRFQGFLNSPDYSMAQNPAYTSGLGSINGILNGQYNDQYVPQGINYSQFDQVVPETRPFQNYDPTAATEFFNTSIRPELRREFDEITAPSVRERYAAAGASSSGAADRALNRARTDYIGNSERQLGSLLYQDRNNFMNREAAREESNLARAAQIGNANAARQASLFGQQFGQDFQGRQAAMDRNMGRQQFGIGAGLNYAQADLGQRNQNLNNFAATLQAGSLQQGLQQAALDRDYDEWLRTQAYNNPWLQQYLGAALNNPQPNSVVNPGRPSPFAGLGNMAQGIGGAMIGKQMSNAGWI